MANRQPPKQYNNGRRYSPETKRRARKLRRQGLSFREVAKIITVATGTAHIWTADIKLSRTQQEEIFKRKKSKVRHWSAEEKRQISKRLKPFQFKQRHNQDSLIKEIKAFYAEHKRIPLKSEFNSRRAFRIYFGTWNNAILAAGFDPNPELFAKRVKAKDGDICDSMSEKIIDDWLSKNKVIHERNKRYPNSKMTADFYLPGTNTYVELFGLKGVNKRYDRNYRRKLSIIQQHKLTLIALSIHEVTKHTFEGKLQEILENSAEAKTLRREVKKHALI